MMTCNDTYNCRLDSNDSSAIMYDCGISYREEVKIYGLWFDGVFLSLIGVIGLVGNLMALIVLSRPKLRDVFHNLLFALACVDLLYIICGGVNYTFRAFEADSDIYTYLFPYFLHPFTQVAMTGTIFMTLAISIERYLGLCHPLLPPQARKSWFYILPVIVGSLALNIPKFMEVNLSFLNGTLPAYGPSDLRLNEEYIRYYIMWTRLFSTALVPVILLLFLNTRIIIDLFSKKVERFGSAKRQSKEINLCLILLCIVLVFFLCHSARIILDIIEFSHVEQVINCPRIAAHQLWAPPYWAQVLYYVSHMMMMLNSSVNFVIYCLVGHTFRRELCRTLGLKHYIAIPAGQFMVGNGVGPSSRRSSGTKLEYSSVHSAIIKNNSAGDGSTKKPSPIET